MLETIRQFAEEQLVPTAGEADDARTAHARYFAGESDDVLAVWDGPRQREAYEWVTVELAEPARGVPLGRRPTTTSTPLRHRRLRSVSSAFGSNSTNPSAWAEELIDRGSAPSTTGGCHSSTWCRRLCYATGRVDDAVGYRDAGRAVIDSGRFDEVPYEVRSWIWRRYLRGRPARDEWVALCRNIIARTTGHRHVS